jgi:DNA ligase-1
MHTKMMYRDVLNAAVDGSKELPYASFSRPTTVSRLNRFISGLAAILIIASCSICLAKDSPADSPQFLLARIWQDELDVSDYWVSEKYDGVRALWDGRQLWTRNGNVIHAPDWFTHGFPQQRLDGELWMGRGRFEQLVSTVRTQQPDETKWRQVQYMVFELPGGKGSFSQRLDRLHTLLQHSNNRCIRLVPQLRLTHRKDLMQLLEKTVAAGGEGLMLHRAAAPYHTGRSDDLLKLKTFQDAEAVVIGHLPGKGKFAGMLGSLLLETPDGIRFRVGSGFTTAERKAPPPIGATVTYKYFGKTARGLPRFASFLRVRSEP